MVRQGMSEPLTLMEAVNHLADMAEINSQSTWLLGLGKPFVFEDFSEEILWHKPNKILQNKEIVKESFSTVYKWLKNLSETQNELLKTSEVRRIIKGIIELAHEAILGLDRYAVLFPNVRESFSELPEYHELIKFYSHRIERGGQKKEEKKEEELPTQKVLFPDLESLRRDNRYELFFIKNQEPLYSEKLLKHLQIIGDFNELFLSQTDEKPFIRIHEVLEDHAYEGAKNIINHTMPYIDDFYKEAMHHKNLPYVASLNKALMALRLAANAKQQEGEKTCLEYYHDFHFFLRHAMQASGYHEKLLLKELDPFSQVLLNLTHKLCGELFLRTETFDESVVLMNYFIERGKTLGAIQKSEKIFSNELKIWVEIVFADRAFRNFLKFFPSGPLMNTFLALQEHRETFDPLLYFIPCQLFSFIRKDFHVTVLRLASPTVQENLESCGLAEEFQGFLRYYQHGLEPDKHLLVNLQDRNLSENAARCKVLEQASKRKEFSKAFFLFSLPKENIFYEQEGEFQQISGAPVFIEKCLEWIYGEDEKGFIFPSTLKKEEQMHFGKKACECIHKEFFENKEALSERERRDFIEFFYQLIILKCIEELAPDSISFTCKDGVDIGPTQTAFFQAILSLFSGIPLDFDTLLSLFFWPALSIRNRSLQPFCLHRSIQCLFFIHSKILENPKAIDAVNGLYHPKMFPVEIKYSSKD